MRLVRVLHVMCSVHVVRVVHIVCAMVCVAHPVPVGHRDVRRLHPFAGADEGVAVTGAVHRSRAQRVGAALRYFDHHIPGLGNRDAQALHLPRLDINAVGGDDGHRPAGELDIKVTRCGGVDQPQPDALAGVRRQRLLALAVGEEQVVADIGRVHRPHAYPRPVQAVFDRRPAARRDPGPRLHGVFLARVVVAVFFQVAKNPRRRLVGPVRQHHGVIAFGGDGFLFGVKNQRAVNAALFLQAAVRVVPVGAGVGHFVLVGERRAGGDRLRRQPRHAVLVVGQQNAVPVHRTLLVQPVAESDAQRVADGGLDGRRRNLAADGDCLRRFAGEMHGDGVDVKGILDQRRPCAVRRQRCQQRRRSHRAECFHGPLIITPLQRRLRGRAARFRAGGGQ